MSLLGTKVTKKSMKMQCERAVISIKKFVNCRKLWILTEWTMGKMFYTLFKLIELLFEYFFTVIQFTGKS